LSDADFGIGDMEYEEPNGEFNQDMVTPDLLEVPSTGENAQRTELTELEALRLRELTLRAQVKELEVKNLVSQRQLLDQQIKREEVETKVRLRVMASYGKVLAQRYGCTLADIDIDTGKVARRKGA